MKLNDNLNDCCRKCLCVFLRMPDLTIRIQVWGHLILTILLTTLKKENYVYYATKNNYQ